MIPIGIDVSKAKLDICHSNKTITIQNQSKDIVKAFKSVARDSRIVLEATGKYHRLAHKVLSELGFEVMVINPFQSRNFAKAMNVICKTDSVDAKVLSMYAEKMDFKPTLVPSEEALEMQELSRHLDDLKKNKVELEARLRDSDGYVAESLKETIDFIGKKITAAGNYLQEKVTGDELLSKKCDLLISIPGIGMQTAIMLLSNLSELGKINKRQISALAGLAPRNNDSGSFSGRRYVKGGRVNVRSNLYMPVLGAATLHNKRLKQFFDHLVSSGKDKKVALIACMRKLIIWANSILARGEKWDEKYV